MITGTGDPDDSRAYDAHVKVVVVPAVPRNLERIYPKNNGGYFTSVATSLIALLNTVARGTATDQRIGSVIHIHALDLVFAVMADTSTPEHFTRWAVFSDQQTNGVIPTVSDISPVGYQWMPFLDYSNTDRFRFYYHQTIAHGGFTTIGVNPIWSNPLNSIKRVTLQFSTPVVATYTGTGGTITNVVTNGLFFAFVHSLVSNPPAVTVYWRVYYSDN